MNAHKQRRDVVLVCNAADVGSAQRKACAQYSDDEAITLARAANIVRRDMFKTKQNNDFGIRLILSARKSQCQFHYWPSIAWFCMVQINNAKKFRNSASSHACTASCVQQFRKHREIPLLPVYLRIKIYTKTRKSELVGTVFNLGLSVLYDRVLGISTELERP